MLLAERYGRLGERYLIVERTLAIKKIWSIAVKAAGTPWPVYSMPMWVMYAGCWLGEKGGRLLGLETEVTVTSLRLTRIVKDFDNSKARKELHWNPRPVEEAIAEAARWYQSQKRRSALRRKASLPPDVSP
jgi:dihydroflavonol-4-reductase